MQILLASAKIMRSFCRCDGMEVSRPLFADIATGFAADMSRLTVEEIEDCFKYSWDILKLTVVLCRMLTRMRSNLFNF